MSILSKLGSKMAMSPIAGGALVGLGIAAATTSGKATQSMIGDMYDAVVGRPGDGAISADEAILGRRLDFNSIINPIGDFIPGDIGAAARDAKYIFQPGPGLLRSEFMNYASTYNSYNKHNYMQAEVKRNFDNRIGPPSSDTTRIAYPNPMSGSGYDRRPTGGYTAYPSRRRANDLNADGSIVFGLHNRRFG